MKKAITGLVVGITCGLFASGGGIVLIPVLVYLMKMDEKEARRLSVFCLFPMVLTTFFIYNKNNYIDWSIGIKCAIGGVIGGIIGLNLLKKITIKWIKIIFTIFLLYMSIRMFIQ